MQKKEKESTRVEMPDWGAFRFVSLSLPLSLSLSRLAPHVPLSDGQGEKSDAARNGVTTALKTSLILV